MYVEFEYHRILCRKCGSVKQETLPWLAASGRFTQRFEDEISQQCRDMNIKRVSRINHLGWAQVKRMERMYLQQIKGHPLSESLRRGGIDENSVGKGHTYRITVSGLDYPRPLPIGGRGGDQEGPDTFFVEIGSARGRKIEIVVLKTGGPFKKSILTAYPSGHIHLW
jgi:transposase